MTKRSAGRPRSAAVEAKALVAVRTLLVESGYSALTLSGVALRAGTTTAALYRRWPSLAHLVYDAAFPAQLSLESPSELDPCEWLISMITEIRDLLNEPVVVAAIPGLMTEFASRPELHEALVSRFSTSIFDKIRDFLIQAAESGLVDANIDPQQVATTIVGSLLVSALLQRENLDDNWVAALACVIWNGLRSRATDP